jgi:hypothetical protein
LAVGKHRLHDPETRVLAGVVRQHNFDPKGGVEGVVLDTATGPVQVNFARGPGSAPATVPPPGTTVRFVVGTDHHAEKHDAGDHPVCEFVAGAEDGAEPSGGAVVEGTVVRLNFARHGEPNGVVLDSGDFVHLKPHGMKQVGLTVGARVTARGASRPTVTGRRAIEATAVNGVEIGHKKPHR